MRRGSITIAVAAALVCVSSGVGRVNANNNNDGWQELREILNNTLGVQGRNTQRLRTEAFVARLSARNEVPPISSGGSGRVEMLLVADAGVIAFRLTYDNLEGGPAPVTPAVAHVHFAPPRVNGGVSFFFCGGSTKPPCPPQPGVVTGAVTMADIVGPAGQGIAAGEFAEIVAAMRAGFTYANVHTPTFGAGEIRGQLRRD